jgi:hypothetical protein
MGVSGQRHAPAAFSPRERNAGTHCTGGWVGPKAGLDTEDRGKILYPCRGSNLDRPLVQSIARHHTAWATPAPGLNVIDSNKLPMLLFTSKGWDCLWTAATNRRTVHPPGDMWVWIPGGMMMICENRRTLRKRVLVPLCSPLIPHGLTRVWWEAGD